MNQIENAILGFGIAVAVILVLMYVIRLLARLGSFLENLRYINMELGRCSVRMREKWRRRKRRLWCSLLIPFYRR